MPSVDAIGVWQTMCLSIRGRLKRFVPNLRIARPAFKTCVILSGRIQFYSLQFCSSLLFLKILRSEESFIMETFQQENFLFKFKLFQTFQIAEVNIVSYNCNFLRWRKIFFRILFFLNIFQKQICLRG